MPTERYIKIGDAAPIAAFSYKPISYNISYWVFKIEEQSNKIVEKTELIFNCHQQVCRYKFAEKVENEPIHLKQADSVSKNGEKSINKLRQLGLVWICEEKNEASSSELGM